MTQSVRVKVHTFEQELDFSIRASTTGNQLMEQIAKILRIYEVWYFGLQYIDKKNRESWIKKNKKIVSQVKQNEESVCLLSLRVEFYPERIEKELIDDTTIRYFFVQAVDDITVSRVTCSLEIWLVLKSLELYATFGPLYQLSDEDDPIIFEKVQLPKHYDVEKENVLPVLKTYYFQHKNLLRVDAMLEYLKIMEHLPGYGVKYHEVTKPKNKQLLLAVQPVGIDVHKRENRYSPEFGFKWSEIGDLSYIRKKFVLQTMDTKGPNFSFQSATKSDVRRLLNDCKETHQMYNFRRRSPTLEMKMLSKQCSDDRHKRKEDMINLNKEKEKRINLELENEKLKEEIATIEYELRVCKAQEKEDIRDMGCSNQENETYLNVKDALALFEKKGNYFKKKISNSAEIDALDNDQQAYENGFLVKKLQSLISDLADAKHKTEYVRSRLIQQDSLHSTLLKCKSILSLSEEQKKNKIVAFENM